MASKSMHINVHWSLLLCLMIVTSGVVAFGGDGHDNDEGEWTLGGAGGDRGGHGGQQRGGFLPFPQGKSHMTGVINDPHGYPAHSPGQQ